jgi:CBS domain-containing protein
MVLQEASDGHQGKKVQARTADMNTRNEANLTLDSRWFDCLCGTMLLIPNAQRRYPMDVRTIMTGRPVAATRNTLLKDVAKMMLDHDVGEIPIVDDDARPLGVVTDRDIVVRLVATGQDPSQVRAGDCMTSPVVTLNVDSDLRECADVMVRERIRRVPIVDDDGRLCGIVALADLERRNDVRSLKAEVSRQVSQPH